MNEARLCMQPQVLETRHARPAYWPDHTVSTSSRQCSSLLYLNSMLIQISSSKRWQGRPRSKWNLTPWG